MSWGSKNMETRICVECGKEYKPKTFNQVTCSFECNDIRQKRLKKLADQRRKEKRKAEEETKAKMLEAIGETPNKIPERRRPLYESANMNAIAEIARYGVHYGQTVAKMYEVEASVNRNKQRRKDKVH